MTKSELIELLARKQSHLSYKDVENAAKVVIEQMSQSLSGGDRRNPRLQQFLLHFRRQRVGRNPKTGDAVTLPGKFAPHFKPGRNCASASTLDRKRRSAPDRPHRQTGLNTRPRCGRHAGSGVRAVLSHFRLSRRRDGVRPAARGAP